MIQRLIMMFSAALMVACSGGGAGAKEELQPVEMSMSSDKVTLTIEKSRRAADALTLSWKGGAQEADYSILMDIAGNGFSKPYTNRLGKCPGRSVTFPSRDLNMTIAELWPSELAKQTDFEFKVVASLGDRTVESGVARVRISSYGTIVQNLWVIGSATSGGWSLGAAQKMKKGPGGQFSWKGTLTTGEIKFLLRQDSWDDFYGFGGDNSTLVYHPETMSGDPKFQIGQLGEYEIILNTAELTITIKMTEEISARVVFLGDSITDCWDDYTTFFRDNGFVNSGIVGETTAQMLARVEPQVIAFKPALMVFLGGINDIARNQGYVSNDQIMNNIRSISSKAKASGAKVILCSILPINDIYWNKSIVVADARKLILDMNARIRDYCSAEGFYYCDYFNLMVDDKGGLTPSYTNDGLHPNKAGYSVMEPFILSAIDKVLE